MGPVGDGFVRPLRDCHVLPRVHTPCVNPPPLTPLTTRRDTVKLTPPFRVPDVCRNEARQEIVFSRWALFVSLHANLNYYFKCLVIA